VANLTQTTAAKDSGGLWSCRGALEGYEGKSKLAKKIAMPGPHRVWGVGRVYTGAKSACEGETTCGPMGKHRVIADGEKKGLGKDSLTIRSGRGRYAKRWGGKKVRRAKNDGVSQILSS